MLTPEGAMNQAGMTAIEYFDVCYKYIHARHPNVSEEVKMQCASRMAIAASIDYATAILGGVVSKYRPEVNVRMSGGLEIYNQ